jgi:3-ketosteroid 9alpha-monooxygenase subunit A
VKVPFTWKVTGWFMIGWSAEFPTGEVRPLRYFGEDLVAYRDESGELHVMTAHCRHLGAHIGHGGKVIGDCVECPFHGWRWGPDGNLDIWRYQEYIERPALSKVDAKPYMAMRKWATQFYEVPASV